MEQEDARRKALENKATYGTGIVLGIVGLVAETAATSAGRFSPAWFLFVVGTVLMLCAVYSTIRAIRVTTYPSLNPNQLGHDDVLACEVTARLSVLLARLVDLVERTEAITNQKARAVAWAQYCSLTGVLCYVLGIVGRSL